MQQPEYHSQGDLWTPLLGHSYFHFPLFRHRKTELLKGQCPVEGRTLSRFQGPKLGD